MAKTIENLFVILHYSVNTLVILIFISFFKKARKEKELIAVAFYCLIDIILNLSVKYLTLSLDWRLYVWSSFTFIEYLIFTFVIWSSLKKQTIKKVIIYISTLFIVFTTIYNIVTNFKSIDSIPIGIETILILIFSFYYLYEQMNDTISLFIYSKYQFWIIIGFMIYLAGSFFVYILANVMEKGLLNQYWFLTNGFYTLMIILFAISFFVFNKQQNNKHTIKTNFHPSIN